MKKTKIGVILIAILLTVTAAGAQIAQFQSTPNQVTEENPKQFKILFDENQASQEGKVVGSGAEPVKITLKTGGAKTILAENQEGLQESQTKDNGQLYSYQSDLSGLSIQDGQDKNIKAVVNYEYTSFGSGSDKYKTGEAQITYKEKEEQKNNNEEDNQDSGNQNNNDEKVNEADYLKSLEPEFSPLKEEKLDGTKVIEWKSNPNENIGLKTEITGNSKTTTVKCIHSVIGTLDSETKKLSGETTYECTIPSLMHKETEKITVKICDQDTSSCREINETFAFGINKPKIGEIETPDTTTGNLPIFINAKYDSIGRLEIQVNDNKLEDLTVNKAEEGIGTEIDQKHLKEGENIVTITLVNKEGDFDTKTVSTSLIREATPNIKIKNLEILQNNDDSVKAEINVSNPSNSIYIDKTSITANSKTVNLTNLYPNKSKAFILKDINTVGTKNLEISHKGRTILDKKLAKKFYSVDKAKNETLALLKYIKNSENVSEYQSELIRIEQKVEALKEWNVSDEVARKTYQKLYENLSSINSTTEVGSSESSDGQNQVITASATDSPTNIFVVIIYLAILTVVTVLGLKYRETIERKIRDKKDGEIEDEGEDMEDDEELTKDQFWSMP